MLPQQIAGGLSGGFVQSAKNTGLVRGLADASYNRMC